LPLHLLRVHPALLHLRKDPKLMAWINDSFSFEENHFRWFPMHPLNSVSGLIKK
jgi:hypothetical protein